MLNRRHMLLAAAAAGVAAVEGAPSLARARTGEVGRLNALLDAIMAQQLRLSPETTTGLGLDVGELAWTKSELGDRSSAAIQASSPSTARR